MAPMTLLTCRSSLVDSSKGTGGVSHLRVGFHSGHFATANGKAAYMHLATNGFASESHGQYIGKRRPHMLFRRAVRSLLTR